MTATTIGLTGMYRDTLSGTYVQIRTVFFEADWFDASWLDLKGQLQHERLARAELERIIRAGLMVRDYGRHIS